MNGGNGHRVAVITGGNRGLGRAIAESFVAAGHPTAVLSRDGSGPPGAAAFRADVRDSEGLASALEEVRSRFGPIEVAVAGAGITRDRTLRRMTDQEFSEVLETNLTGTYRLFRLVADEMVAGTFGRMIAISSIGAVISSFGQANYAASKAGLLGLVRAITGELAPYGVTANVVAPGFFDTDMTAGLASDRREQILARVPAGRPGRHAELASAVRWLAGDAAGYVTGAWIPVDGGAGMGH